MASPARLGASPVIGSDELDALSLGLAVVDARWEIVRWTRALAELTGIPSHKALGTSVWDRLPALRATPAEAALRAAMRNRIPYRGPPLPLSEYDAGPVLRSVAPLGDDAILLELDRSAIASGETAALDQRLPDHAALAIRARQHAAAAERSAREAHALTEVIQRINQSLELDRVVAIVAQYAGELVGGVGARVLIADEDELRASGTYGIAEPSPGAVVPKVGSFAGECLRTRAPLRTADLGAPDPRWPATGELAQPGRYSAIAIPLLVADRAIGVIDDSWGSQPPLRRAR